MKMGTEGSSDIHDLKNSLSMHIFFSIPFDEIYLFIYFLFIWKTERELLPTHWFTPQFSTEPGLSQTKAKGLELSPTLTCMAKTHLLGPAASPMVLTNRKPEVEVEPDLEPGPSNVGFGTSQMLFQLLYQTPGPFMHTF